jgi:hypothetical protein
MLHDAATVPKASPSPLAGQGATRRKAGDSLLSVHHGVDKHRSPATPARYAGFATLARRAADVHAEVELKQLLMLLIGDASSSASHRGPGLSTAACRSPVELRTILSVSSGGVIKTATERT